MRTLVIGDIHGRDFWKGLTQKHSVDKVVFVGDYVDSYDIPTPKIRENLEDIVNFARNNIGKVELLVGNHDIQYIFHPKYQCSGFNSVALFDYQIIFRENRDLFKAAHLQGDYLISHAGVTQSLWNLCGGGGETDGIDETINYLYERNFYTLFWVGRLRGGVYPTPGIFWADKRELLVDPLLGYNQIVGHTPSREVHDEETFDGHILKFIDTSSENSFCIIE